MLESFWGYCERVQEQTSEVNISGGFVFRNGSLLPLEHENVVFLLVIKVHLEAHTQLQRCPTEIKIMMSVFPVLPLLFSFARSMCLIFSGNIIYSDGAPQAKVGGGKKKTCTHWPDGWFLRSARL